MKKLFSILAVSSVLVACVATTNEDGTVIKIGYLGPLTGDAASYGVDTFNGTKMKVDEINAKGGINGAMIELIAEDGRCTGADAMNAAQKLINVDGVIAIIGGQCSGETLAAAPIAEAAGIPMISPISSSPDVTAAGEFVFRNYPSDALKTTAMAQYFADEGIETIAMITENTDFAMAFRASLKESLPEGAVVFDEVVAPGTKDFRTLVTRLKGVEFDMFFPNGQTDAIIAAMMEQIAEQGIETPAIGHDVADSVTLAELAGDAVNEMFIINVPTAGEGTSFERSFVEKYGAPQASIAWPAHAYDAMGVLAEAIENAGTDGAAIRDWLYNMSSYGGIIGRFSFDENGDVTGLAYALKQFQDGAIVVIDEIAVD